MEDEPLASIYKWDAHQVSCFIKGFLGQDRYTRSIRRNNVNERSLLYMSVASWEALGVDISGHRFALHSWAQSKVAERDQTSLLRENQVPNDQKALTTIQSSSMSHEEEKEENHCSSDTTLQSMSRSKTPIFPMTAKEKIFLRDNFSLEHRAYNRNLERIRSEDARQGNDSEALHTPTVHDVCYVPASVLQEKVTIMGSSKIISEENIQCRCGLFLQGDKYFAWIILTHDMKSTSSFTKDDTWYTKMLDRVNGQGTWTPNKQVKVIDVVASSSPLSGGFCIDLENTADENKRHTWKMFDLTKPSEDHSISIIQDFVAKHPLENDEESDTEPFEMDDDNPINNAQYKKQKVAWKKQNKEELSLEKERCFQQATISTTTVKTNGTSKRERQVPARYKEDSSKIPIARKMNIYLSRQGIKTLTHICEFMYT
ncbi:hypothetical protein GOP47_0006218 [Adiantum capillus-veneris]|uniref:SAM domain-containing protein n=1 Tax=Adiantum capillus-veneris TaxID=13818 RepID=A0A9D4ZLU1_ADICA|nr:hypothetical protein GOP47_0006218 [Adiantum capillus-veneris]